jgi:hypothetical protein
VSRRRYRILAAVLLPLVLLAACADVKPWQKGRLARPEMAFEGDALAARLAQHIYFSKENASGGYGVGGGGCGCN